MSRGPIVALQRRKFRLLVRWKSTLKAFASFEVLPPAFFPHTVIFRVFDAIVRQMKLAASDAPLDSGKPVLPVARDTAGLSPDQYMDIFFAGREVLADFLASDAKLVAHYAVDVRNRVRHDLDRAVRHLVDREMQEYSQRRARALPQARGLPSITAPAAGEVWASVLREA